MAVDRCGFAFNRDRVNMTLPSVQRDLFDAVARVSKRLIIVVVSAGGVDLGAAYEGAADAIMYVVNLAH